MRKVRSAIAAVLLGLLATVPASRTTAAGSPLHVEVTQDPVGQKGLYPNYVAIFATVTDAQTGAPVELEYTLEAGVRSPAGVFDRTVFHLAYPYEIDSTAVLGRYQGVVIVPSGGRWTISVNVFDRIASQTQKIPVALAAGELTVDVNAGTLPSAGQFGRAKPPKANRSEVLVRLIHSFVGLSWMAVVGLLALIGLPNRVLLSGSIGGLIERNLARVTIAAVWLTGLVWATGLWNLKDARAFAPPLSAKQADRIFLVPYARPYIYSLYLKIAVTVLLTVLTIPIVRRARAMTVGRSDRTGKGLGLPFAVAIGGATVLICVTLLTYIHALAERVSAVR